MNKGQTYKVNSLYKGTIVLGVYKHYTVDVFLAPKGRFKTASWVLLPAFYGGTTLGDVLESYEKGSTPFQIIEFLPIEEFKKQLVRMNSKVTWVQLKEYEGERVGFTQTNNIIIEIDNELKEWKQEDL